MPTHRLHRIGPKGARGLPGIRYVYRGVFIECAGYYPPEHRVCWNGIDSDGICGFAHGTSLSDTMAEIDRDIDVLNVVQPYTAEAVAILAETIGSSKEDVEKYFNL